MHSDPFNRHSTCVINGQHQCSWCTAEKLLWLRLSLAAYGCTLLLLVTFASDEFAVSRATEHMKAAINRSCKKSRNTSRWETPVPFSDVAMGWAEWTKSTEDPEFQAEDFFENNIPVTLKIRTYGYQTLERFIAARASCERR